MATLPPARGTERTRKLLEIVERQVAELAPLTRYERSFIRNNVVADLALLDAEKDKAPAKTEKAK